MKMTLMEFRRLVRMEITKFASQLSTALRPEMLADAHDSHLDRDGGEPDRVV